MNKKILHPANVQMRPVKEEDVDAIAVIAGMYFGAPRPEYHWEKLGSAGKGAGINTSLAAEARTSMLQAECKR